VTPSLAYPPAPSRVARGATLLLPIGEKPSLGEQAHPLEGLALDKKAAITRTFQKGEDPTLQRPPLVS
jgi:hypothetical protein